MGGAWERMIHFIRKILNALIGSQTLNDEGLIIMTEVEDILNSKRLAPIMYDNNGQKPFTLNHLLLFKVTPKIPPDFFDMKHCYTRRRLAQIQYTV